MSHLEIYIHLHLSVDLSSGCPTAAGDSSGSWPLADAAELSPAGSLAQRFGEGLGEAEEATPRLPAMADDRAHTGVPHWNPAAFSESCD